GYVLVGWSGALAFGLDRPEDAAFAGFVDGGEHRGVDHAPRRSEQTRRRAGDLGDRVVGATDLFGGGAGAAEPEVGVGPGVVGELVTLGGDALHDGGGAGGALADEEERGVDAGGSEEVEDAGRPL